MATGEPKEPHPDFTSWVKKHNCARCQRGMKLSDIKGKDLNIVRNNIINHLNLDPKSGKVPSVYGGLPENRKPPLSAAQWERQNPDNAKYDNDGNPVD